MEGRTSFVRRGGALDQMRIVKGVVHKGKGRLLANPWGVLERKLAGMGASGMEWRKEGKRQKERGKKWKRIGKLNAGRTGWLGEIKKAYIYKARYICLKHRWVLKLNF